MKLTRQFEYFSLSLPLTENIITYTKTVISWNMCLELHQEVYFYEYHPQVEGVAVTEYMLKEAQLPRMCDTKDSVMVDKGFDVQDIFATKDVTVNINIFLKIGISSQSLL